MGYTFLYYVEDLYKMAVGVMNFTPSAFYSSELREVKLAIEGYNMGKQQDFYLSQTAMKNAIGVFFGGKKFKPTNPFEKESKKVERATTEEKAETFNYLHDKFNTKEGEDN